MPTTTTCECGTCRKCKHRVYMRRYYHERKDAASVLVSRTYLSRTSGGRMLLSCEWCERVFETTVRMASKSVGAKRFCCRGCKDAMTKAMLRYRRSCSKPDRRCRHCGKAMSKKMKVNARYCSAACNSAAHHHTRKASARLGARQERIDRASIIAKSNGQCHLCGAFPKGRDLTIDHVVPLAEGGSHSFENLAVACLSCNCSKGARPLHEMGRSRA